MTTTAPVLATARALTSHGIDFLRDIHALPNGTLPNGTEPLTQLAAVYFGDTPFTTRQRSAREAATAHHHGWITLEQIEKYTRRLTRSDQQWQLRETLCATPAERIPKVAAATLRKLKPPTPRRRGIRILRAAGNNPDYLAYTGPARLVHALYDRICSSGTDNIDQAVEKLLFAGNANSTVSNANSLATGANSTAINTASPATGANSTVRNANSPVSGANSAAINTSSTEATDNEYSNNINSDTPVEAIPHITIRVEDLHFIHGAGETNSPETEGSDNTDCYFRMTNGARVSGKEVAEMTLAAYGYVTLLDPVEGPVNTYRTARHANWKQRIMAAAEHPHCAWPSCRYPAMRSHIHHLKAWKHGGETNMKNLITLCAYHNGVNDDGAAAGVPSNRTRGYMTRQDGRVVWIPSPSFTAQPLTR